MSAQGDAEAKERELKRIEWKARLAKAQKSYMTLAQHEQSVVQSVASRGANTEAGQRPDKGPRPGIDWAYDLSPGEHARIERWQYEYDLAFVREVERLERFKTQPVAAQGSWSEGRE